MRRVKSLIAKIARYDAPVLIDGETGTGKELAARAIHYQGRRRDQPFVPVNCGAIPDSLVENELFGHDRGAFTDARERRQGLVACAEGGTLFLDEVDALSPRAQVALLRFLQDQLYRPLGSGRHEQANVRVIAATNANLQELCRRGTFRLDLFYRLCLLELSMPPLRERDGDIPLLAVHFRAQIAAQQGQPEKVFAPETLHWFGRYAWPGNVRELENLVSRAVLLSEEDVICIAPAVVESIDDDSDPYALEFSRGKALTLKQFERSYVSKVLARAKGNVTLAARLSGKERRAFGKLMKKHGMDRAEFGAET